MNEIILRLLNLKIMLTNTNEVTSYIFITFILNASITII